MTATLVLAGILAAAPVPKETAAKKIERIWGTPTDPEATDAFKLTPEGNLALTVAKGLRGLNPSRGLNNCPRTYRAVSGDFTVTIQLLKDATPDGSKKATDEYSASGGGGMLIWADETNHLRISRSQWVADAGLAAKTTYNFRGNIGGDENPAAQTEVPPTTAPAWFRMTRKGTRFGAGYSADGKRWNDFQPVEAEFPADLKVGVYGAHNFDKDNTLEFAPLTVTVPEKK